MLFVLDEVSYDRHNEHFSDIYRIYVKGKIQGNELEAALSNAPMGATLKEDFPEVKDFTRLYTFDGDPIVRYEEKVFIVGRTESAIGIPLQPIRTCMPWDRLSGSTA